MVTCVSAFLHSLSTWTSTPALICPSRTLVRQRSKHFYKTVYAMPSFSSPSPFSPYLRKVEKKGSQCKYPDHASPKCSFGNVCDFDCADGFSKVGASCVCLSPKSVCNGKCGSYQNVRTSFLIHVPEVDVSAGLHLGASKGSKNGTKEYPIISRPPAY